MPPLIIITIQLPWQRAHFRSAPAFNVQLDLLIEMLDIILSKNRFRYPESHIIVLTHEYAIFDHYTRETHTILDYDKKCTFKQRLHDFVASIKIDNFTIVPGTILHFRDLFDKQKAEQYGEKYKLENTCYVMSKKDGHITFIKYKKLIDAIETTECSAFMDRSHHDESPFYKDKTHKMTFQGGSEDAKPFTFHPQYGTFDVEICADHGRLKRYYDKHPTLSTPVSFFAQPHALGKGKTDGAKLAVASDFQESAASSENLSEGVSGTGMVEIHSETSDTLARPSMQVILSNSIMIAKRDIIASDWLVQSDANLPPKVIKIASKPRYELIPFYVTTFYPGEVMQIPIIPENLVNSSHSPKSSQVLDDEHQEKLYQMNVS
jgi:hypothetical protein